MMNRTRLLKTTTPGSPLPGSFVPGIRRYMAGSVWVVGAVLLTALLTVPTRGQQAEVVMSDLSVVTLQTPQLSAAGVLSDAEASLLNGEWLRLTVDTPVQMPAQVLITTDGQHLPGSFPKVEKSSDAVFAEAGAEAVIWQTAGDVSAGGASSGGGGRLVLGLDRVRMIVLTPGVDWSGVPMDTDTLVLTNGDRLMGFLLELSLVAASFIPSGETEPIQVGVDRLAALRLANPDGSVSAPYRVALADGSRLLASSVELVGNKLEVAAVWEDSAFGTRVLTVAASDLRQIDALNGPTRLINLLEQPMTVVSGGEMFGLSMPPEKTGDQLDLHAPVGLSFALPAGAERVALTALLNHEQAPAGFLNTADCDLSVRWGEASNSTRLWRKTPRTRIVMANPLKTADAGDLLITLEPGRNGPVLDRVRIQEAFITLKTPAPAPER